MGLSLAQAMAVARGALDKGRALSMAPLTVAVLDAGGHPVVLLREDGASSLRPDIATAKAAGALGLGMSSRSIAQMAVERPAFVQALALMAPKGLAPAAGGVILHAAGGCVIGAVGVSGDTSDNDEICAIAGAQAAGLATKA